MSDIPFALIMMLTILFYYKIKQQHFHFSLFTFHFSLLLGILISVRAIGIALAAALVLDGIMETIWRYKESKLLIINYSLLITLITAATVYYLLNVVIFHVPYGGILYQGNIFHVKNIAHIVLGNITYNINCFAGFFTSCTVKLPFIALITQPVILAFALLGFMNKTAPYFLNQKERIHNPARIIDFFVMFYMLILLLYPVNIAGNRYLLPIFPFLLYYAAIGVESIKLNININKHIIAMTFGLFVLLPYSMSIFNIVQHQKETLAGPQEPASLEAFDYIMKNVPQNAAFAFAMPRALALYTGRKATRVMLIQNNEVLTERFRKEGINYFLTNVDIPDKGLDFYLERNKAQIKLLWSNQKFRLYGKVED